jgi:hypothetical protein
VTLFHALGPFASAGVVAAPGMVLMKPTSITHSGTSATLGANGQVTFTAVTSLSLNGVFTAGFDNYQISLSGVVSSADNISMRLRLSGSDATATNYTRQYIDVSNTSVSAGRQTSNSQANAGFWSTAENGTQILVYGAALAQPTAFRTVMVGSSSGAYISEYASTHSLSTAYDGFTVFAEAGGGRTLTGEVTVYGLRS